MSKVKTLKERIEELYSSAPEPLDGVIEIKQLKIKLEEKFSKSGKSSKTKEGALYQEALSKIEEAYQLLERSGEGGINFDLDSVSRLQQDASLFLAKHHNDEKEKPTLGLCSKLIIDCQNYNAANKKKSATGKKSNSKDPEKDAAVLEAVEKAIKWSSDGENAKTIKEKLLVAIDDPKIDHVKYRQDKNGNNKSSIFVNGKAMNFDTAKLAAGRALKVEAENPEGKYKKNGFLYLRKN